MLSVQVTSNISHSEAAFNTGPLRQQNPLQSETMAKPTITKLPGHPVTLVNCSERWSLHLVFNYTGHEVETDKFTVDPGRVEEVRLREIEGVMMSGLYGEWPIQGRGVNPIGARIRSWQGLESGILHGCHMNLR